MVNTRLLQKANLIVHGVQVLFSIVIIGVIAASMVQPGSASGPARFNFALCWISIPGLIYLTMTPRFQRTKMLAHPYWVIGINTIFTIFWFAAFISLAVYTNKGISAGESKEKDSKIKEAGGCALFPAGTGESEKACKLNRSGVGLGVFMWFLWLTTTGIAGWAAFYFSKNSVSPFEDLSTPSHDITETTKDAFSSNDEYALINNQRGAGSSVGGSRLDDYDDTPYDDVESSVGGSRVGYGQSNVSGAGYGQSNVSGAGYSDSDVTGHPGSKVAWGAEREPYAGIGGHAPIAPPEGPDDYSYRGAGGRY